MEEAGISEEVAQLLASLSKDAGPILKLSNSFFLPGGNIFAQKSFFVKGTQFFGPVVATPLAIYLCKCETHGRGVAGEVLYHAMAKDSTMCSCTVGDLPPQVQHFVGERGAFHTNGAVIIPKDAVKFIASSFMTSSFKFQVGADVISVAISIFVMGKRKRELKEIGWELNKPLTPTAPAVHDLESR